MKKLVTLLLFAGCMLLANAQNFQRGDTLLMGQRWPSYYYWGDNWFDSKYDPANKGGIGTKNFGVECKPEIARYIYADSSLRVIGIAVAYDIFFLEQDQWGDEDTAGCMKEYKTDYFRLYEVDSTTGEMILIAEKPLTDLEPACYLPKYAYGPIMGRKPVGYHMREVFFDSAITVYDSFYVAATQNNNYRSSNKVRTRINSIYQRDDNDKPTCYPEPNHYRRKLHKVDDWDYDIGFLITDTNWHVIHMTWTNLNLCDNTPQEWSGFMMMFPILDTTPDHSWLPECKRPKDLNTIHVGKEVVVLGWESEGASQWELKVGKEGSDLDSVAAIDCSSDVAPVYGLDTATWYIATVRSICGENRISLWSDTLRFFVPGDTTSTGPTESIETIAEKFTYLMPNPASDNVTVMSSFRIDRIEVYSLTGQRVMQQKVGALSTQIDLSGLPKGTYIVRTYTNHGISNKRLVVK